MVKYIALITVAVASFMAWTNFPVHHGPGIKAPESPEINRIMFPKESDFKNGRIKPTHTLKATVRILDKERFYFGDKNEYSPVDILVGWKDMSDNKNLDFMLADANNRAYSIQYSEPPMSVNRIYQHSDLWHLLPTDQETEDLIKSLRTGHIIKVKGQIVDLKVPGQYNWKSRNDSKEKPGSRLIKVEHIEIKNN